MTPTRTEIIILATRTQNVLGEKGKRIRELTSVVQKRFSFPEGTVEVCTFTVTHYISELVGPNKSVCGHSNVVLIQLYAEKVAARGLCAIAQCESLRYKLIGGLAVRRLV